MDLKGKLKHGMRIVGVDKAEYGTIERFDDEHVYVGGRAVPHSAFERTEKDQLYVGQAGARYFGENTARRMTIEGDIRVPVVEERLEVGTRQVELGEVEIRKTVESEQVSIPVELMREHVEVSRVDVAARPATEAQLADGFREATIRVPVRGEEAIVSKEARVTGEVVIDRERVTERETVGDTVRREHVTVDEDYDAGRATGRAQARQPRASDTTSAGIVETGHAEMAPRVMPSEGETDETGDGESWDRLRGDIRDAADRARR
ncbi:MAG: YsnF/AvaK domain-containing protein [Chloroflexota bacterium]|nr:YsnF/AvaK domain-containing protein [Chloroflexota bacterium]